MIQRSVSISRVGSIRAPRYYLLLTRSCVVILPCTSLGLKDDGCFFVFKLPLCIASVLIGLTPGASSSVPRSMPLSVSECRYQRILRGVFRAAQSQPCSVLSLSAKAWLPVYDSVYIAVRRATHSIKKDRTRVSSA
jgi:hypothetical protein